MAKLQIFKLERDQSQTIQKALGIFLILIAIIILMPYIMHFIKILLAILLIFLGIYFLTKETRFRWFRIRRF